jgi:hypothetical protein
LRVNIDINDDDIRKKKFELKPKSKTLEFEIFKPKPNDKSSSNMARINFSDISLVAKKYPEKRFGLSID